MIRVHLRTTWMVKSLEYQSSASLAFARGIHGWPVNSPHKGPVMRKMFPFEDVVMGVLHSYVFLMLLKWTLGTDRRILLTTQHNLVDLGIQDVDPSDDLSSAVIFTNTMGWNIWANIGHHGSLILHAWFAVRYAYMSIIDGVYYVCLFTPVLIVIWSWGKQGHKV